MIKPTIAYQWESHLDQSLATGFARHVPIPWLIAALDLRSDIDNLGMFCGSDSVPIVVCGGNDRHSYVLIRRNALLSMARRCELEPVWTVIGERIGLTDDNNERPDIRVRYNGLLWLDEDVPQMRYWSRPD